MLYALGNVYLSVGDLTYAFEYHGRALNQWLATLGKGHHRTIVSEMLLTNSVWTTWQSKIIRMLSKLGSSSCRTLTLTNSFRSYLDQALKIFASRTYHRNELARSTYKQGQLHAAIGQHDAADQAFRSAYKLRSMIVLEDKRPMDELCEKDYDDMVIYWSR